MKWKATWKYMPVNYNTDIGVVENITQRTVFQNNLNGEKLKLKFSNKYGAAPLTLEKVIVRKNQNQDNTLLKEQECCVVTKDGAEKIVIAPGEEFYSDEMEWNVKAGEDILLFIYFKEKQAVQSSASVWSTRCTRTQYYPGAYCLHTGSEGWKESRQIYPYVEADANKADIVAGITEILLYTDSDVKSIALFGDSITHMSYFSDALTEKIMEHMPGRVAVENYGIGGNRILRDASFAPALIGQGSCFGPAGQSRFEKDVFGEDTPDLVVMLEGVNDIMHPYVFEHPDEIVSADDLEQGISKIIEIAHKHKTPILLGTVMPFWNEQYLSWIQKGEAVRTELNTWIKEKSQADGVIDYAQAATDPKNPSHMKNGIHIGDGLHPNTQGGRIMAQAAFHAICKQMK